MRSTPRPLAMKTSLRVTMLLLLRLQDSRQQGHGIRLYLVWIQLNKSKLVSNLRKQVDSLSMKATSPNSRPRLENALSLKPDPELRRRRIVILSNSMQIRRLVKRLRLVLAYPLILLHHKLPVRSQINNWKLKSSRLSMHGSMGRRFRLVVRRELLRMASLLLGVKIRDSSLH